MSPFRNIERRLEGLFERGFRRAFRSQLQPVELARKLAREMDNHKTVSVSRVYGPNEFHVFLSPEDREVFESYEMALMTELETYLASHARSAGLSLVARPVVELDTDDQLRPGEFGISCRMEEQVPPSAAAQANPFDEHISEQPPAVAPVPVPQAHAQAPAAPAPEAPAPQAPASQPPAPAAPAQQPAAAPAANAALAGVSGTQVLPADAVAAAAAGPQLWLEFGGERHLVADDVTTLGRSRSCDVVVGDANVSRTHAEIRRSGAGFTIVDLDSTNGVEVNGRPVTRHALVDGDDVLLGATHIRVGYR